MNREKTTTRTERRQQQEQMKGHDKNQKTTTRTERRHTLDLHYKKKAMDRTKDEAK
jgi:hypothetical protein